MAFDLKSPSDVSEDRQKLDRRVAEMELERSSFISHYQEIAEFLDPRRGRFFIEDRNKGDKRHKNIINSKATVAARKATAGMLAGAMSPSRPWYEFTFMNKDWAEDRHVKMWLGLLQRITLMVFAKSNFYQMAPTMLRELLMFGTGCMIHEDNFEDVARFYTSTVGSYLLAQNHQLQINTIVRQFQKTTIQMVSEFGLDKVPTSVRNSYDRSNYNNWHSVTHVIEPNPNRDPTKITSEFFTFRSVYFDPKKPDSGYLSYKGYRGFPAYTPRWEVTGEDIYGTNCPGMTCLGDVKQLQFQEKEKAKAIAKANNPPLQGPSSLQNSPVSNVPGGVTINASSASGGKIESLYNITPHTQELLLDIAATERRIDEIFFVPLFMAITEMQGIQPKNELQLSQVDAERMLQIGPALEQIHTEWLGKMVLRAAQQVLDAGIMPPAPKLIQGKSLELEFVSALARAQRSVSISAIERTVGFAGSMAQMGMPVMEKVDSFRVLNEYADLVGMPPELIIPDDEARAQQQKAQQVQQMQTVLGQAQQAANVAKMASDAKLGDPNMLSKMTGAQK